MHISKKRLKKISFLMIVIIYVKRSCIKKEKLRKENDAGKLIILGIEI